MPELLEHLWRGTYPFLGYVLLINIAVIFFMIIAERMKNQKTRNSFNKMLKTFHELDEQAKLIIKTDLELNKAQEELDKRFTGLNALQKISRLVSTTLIEHEIFERLSQPLLTELGFEKYLIIVWDAHQGPVCRVNWDFSDKAAEHILELIRKNTALLEILNANSMVVYDENVKEENPVIRIPQLQKFVIAPVLTQNTLLGLILAANNSIYSVITEADKEVISILADQIGQSVRNARLFEEVYMSHQGLELKVEDRTKQLTTALEEVRKISQMKSEFVSAVSHELRTPLTSIKGYASILMAGKVGKIPPEVKERLEKINKHSDNLVKMINELLDISRIESGRITMQYTQRPLQPILDNIKDLMAPQFKEKEISFVLETAGQLPQVMMDPTQIERVLINLVGNAVKFTPHHGTITIKAQHDDEKITVKVTDTGIGIKQQDLDHLFEEFYRGDNEVNQNVKGTGLGLSLAKKIVEAHKGKIWVTSQIDKGTSFYFTLPLTK